MAAQVIRTDVGMHLVLSPFCRADVGWAGHCCSGAVSPGFSPPHPQAGQWGGSLTAV